MCNVTDYNGHTICKWDSKKSILEMQGSHKEKAKFKMVVGQSIKVEGRGCQSKIMLAEDGELVVSSWADNEPNEIKTITVR